MIYSGEDSTRLKRQRTKEAISLAMEGRWEEAAAVNREILEISPTDVDAHNRLGRALNELGDYAQAREAYSRALELDPNNNISQKNVSRLQNLTSAQLSLKGDSHKVDPKLFIEETGKAGLVNLYHLAPKEVLARAGTGGQVNLKVKGQSLVAENKLGEYLGEADPRYGLRLIKLMEGGNRYVAAIASLGEESVKVMIREVFQHPSQVGRLSFPPKTIDDFRPYVRDSLIRYELEDEEEDEFAPEDTTPFAE
jgi:tetratricopeptide (TPR) repeat protein